MQHVLTCSHRYRTYHECINDASLLSVEYECVGLSNQVFNKTILTVHIRTRVRDTRLGVGSVGLSFRVKVITEGNNMPYTRVEAYMYASACGEIDILDNRL